MQAATNRRYRNNSISTRTKLTFQLTPAAINGILLCRSTVAPSYIVFDAFHTVLSLFGLESLTYDHMERVRHSMMRYV